MPRWAWNKGLTKETDEKIKAYSEKLSNRIISPHTRGLIAITHSKGGIVYDRCQECGREKGHSKRLRCNLCAAKWRAENYPNGMKGKKLSDKHKNALIKSNSKQTQLTKPEFVIFNMLDYIFGSTNPFRYSGCGNDRFWISTKNKTRNPDFVAPKLKKVIEVFGTYWHQPEDEGVIKSDYEKVGWSCLVVWEKDYAFLRDALLYFTYPEERQRELYEHMKIPLGEFVL